LTNDKKNVIIKKVNEFVHGGLAMTLRFMVWHEGISVPQLERYVKAVTGKKPKLNKALTKGCREGVSIIDLCDAGPNTKSQLVLARLPVSCLGEVK
jgi:hypothetical protein